jgi:tetratricopeptide (TPR) repeat protein
MRITWPAVAVWLCAAFALTLSAQAGEDVVANDEGPPGLPQEAATAIEAGDWTKVAEALQPLAEGESEPGEEIHYWYGVALYEQGHYDTAVKHLAAALEANPQSRSTARYLARAAFEARSTPTIEQALAAFPDDSVILCLLGRRHIHLFNYYYESSYRADNTVAYLHLEQMIDCERRAVAADPTDVEARLWLAKALKRHLDTEEAIEQILIADRLEPLGYDAYVLLGDCYVQADDDASAAEAYAVAAELSPAEALRIDWERGLALWRAERNDEAVEVFRDIFRRDNQHLQVRFMLGRAAYDAGDYALALFGFREAFAVDERLDALAWSARCAYDLGQDELAVELVNKAIDAGQARMPEGETYSVPSMWLWVRGRALWQLGHEEEAVVDLEEAARKQPSNEDYATWAIYAFRRLKDPFGIVRVVRRYGNNGHAEEGLQLLQEVMRMWRFPPRTDHLGKRYAGGLSGQVYGAAAELQDELGHYRTAYLLARQAGYSSRRTASSWSSWLAFRTGKTEEAERMFALLADKGSSDWAKQLGEFGLTYMALLRRDAEAARTHANAIVDENLEIVVPTALAWADVFAGTDGAAEKLTPFDLLGVYGTWYDGEEFERGLTIQGLIPGSPLANVVPKIEPLDVIIRAGDQWLQSDAGVRAYREAPMPDGPTRVVLRRGDHVFEVYVDLAAARAAAARTAAAMAEKEAGEPANEVTDAEEPVQ